MNKSVRVYRAVHNNNNNNMLLYIYTYCSYKEKVYSFSCVESKSKRYNGKPLRGIYVVLSFLFWREYILWLLELLVSPRIKKKKKPNVVPSEIASCCNTVKRDD